MKNLIDDIEIQKGFSKLNNIISHLSGFDSNIKTLIKNMSHKNNLKKTNDYDFSIKDDKFKSQRIYFLLNDSKDKKLNLEEYKKKSKKIYEEKLKKKLNDNIYKLNINTLTRKHIETIKKNKVLSNVTKSYNPKYDLIFKRTPNVIFSYPKTIIRKNKSSINILLENKKKKINNKEKRKNSIQSENNSPNKSIQFNKDSIFHSQNSKKILSRNNLPTINYHEDDSFKKLSNINYLTKNNSMKNFRIISNKKTNKTVLNKKIYYYPDYSKISKKDKLKYSNQKKKDNNLLSQASIGSYEPKYDFVMEKSPEFSFNNKYKFDKVSFRKFIIKKLWCGYNRSLNEEYQLVELPPKVNNSHM